jgi:nucleoside-triphosphate--adenylate kinase
MMMTPAARNFGTAVVRGGHRRHHGLGPTTAAAAIIPPALLSPNNKNNKNNNIYSAPRNNRSLASLARDGGGGGDDGGPSSSHSLLILGKPGGGKGTISGMMLSDFPQFRHVSTGDELRQHVRSGTELGREAKRYMDGTFPPSSSVAGRGSILPSRFEEVSFVVFTSFAPLSRPGKKKTHYLLPRVISLDERKKTTTTTTTTTEGCLVPDRVMIDLVMGDAIEAIKSGQSLLLDGFPRTMEQAVALDANLDVGLVINLCVPNEVIISRISDRWIHPGSGRVYSYSYRPPEVEGVDDETGEPLVQRDDDKPESVLRRLEKYEDVTRPLVGYYEEKGVIQTFRGTESDVIYPEVKRWLDDRLSEDVDHPALDSGYGMKKANA